MKKGFITSIFLFIFSNLILAQGTAGENAKYEYRSLIDMPTAGILEKGFVGLTTDIMPAGVVIAKLEVGAFDNLSFGISYGGSNIIGTGTPSWYKLPGINLRFRLLDESLTLPALAVGFDSQGKGQYFDSTNRYEYKSPGFFAAASKNFAFLGYLSLHGTVNYSLESKDGDNFVNLYLGFEKTIGKSFSVVGEYNFTLNDNNSNDYYGKGHGYLNCGVRWAVGQGFTLGFDLRDLLDNKKWSPSVADRALKIEYIQSIF
jgi:Exopolysaccharide biosynthesis protein YbjH